MPDPFLLATHVRRTLHRPAVRRITVTVTALATALAAVATLRAADSARNEWGPSRPVAVAQRDLLPGDVVDGSSVTLRSLPEALLNDAALDIEPLGSVVRHPIAAGEPLIADRLAAHGVTGLAALVPPGHRAVGVPTPQAALPALQAGHRVDILIILPDGSAAPHPDPGLLPPGGERPHYEQVPPAFPLVEDAAVLDTTDDQVTLAVPADAAARVAYAVATGMVVLALTGH